VNKTSKGPIRVSTTPKSLGSWLKFERVLHWSIKCSDQSSQLLHADLLFIQFEWNFIHHRLNYLQYTEPGSDPIGLCYPGRVSSVVGCASI